MNAADWRRGDRYVPSPKLVSAQHVKKECVSVQHPSCGARVTPWDVLEYACRELRGCRGRLDDSEGYLPSGNPAFRLGHDQPSHTAAHHCLHRTRPLPHGGVSERRERAAPPSGTCPSGGKECGAAGALRRERRSAASGASARMARRGAGRRSDNRRRDPGAGPRRARRAVELAAARIDFRHKLSVPDTLMAVFGFVPRLTEKSRVACGTAIPNRAPGLPRGGDNSGSIRESGGTEQVSGNALPSSAHGSRVDHHQDAGIIENSGENGSRVDHPLGSVAVQRGSRFRLNITSGDVRATVARTGTVVVTVRAHRQVSESVRQSIAVGSPIATFARTVGVMKACIP